METELRNKSQIIEFDTTGRVEVAPERAQMAREVEWINGQIVPRRDSVGPYINVNLDLSFSYHTIYISENEIQRLLYPSNIVRVAFAPNHISLDKAEKILTKHLSDNYGKLSGRIEITWDDQCSKYKVCFYVAL